MPFNFNRPRNQTRFRFLGYMRVSKNDDLTGSHTFQTQEMWIREFLDRACGNGKYDLELFTDDGVSGALSFRPTARQRKIRPALKALVEQIETGAYDALVVYAQNRLFRNPRGLTEMIEDVLLPSSTALLSATEHIDISTEDGKSFVGFRGIIEGVQRSSIMARCLDAATTTRRFGYYVGQVPYGWDWVRGERGERIPIAPVPEQRELLLWMRERYLAGWSANKIAGDLNSRDVPPASATARWKKKREAHPSALWTGNEVYRLLSCPTHAGLLQDPDLLEAAEKRLIAAQQPLPSQLKALRKRSSRRHSPTRPDFERNIQAIQLTFNHLQAAGVPLEHLEGDEAALNAELARWQRLAEMGYRYGRHYEHRFWTPEEFEAILATHEIRMERFGTITARSDNHHLLAGLIHCARCGKRLYARGDSAKGYQTYRCDNGLQQGQRTCQDMCVRGEWVEAAVFKELERLAALPSVREMIHHAAVALQAKDRERVPREAKDWQAALDKLEKKEERFVELYGEGDLPKESYRKQMAKLQLERETLQRQLREHEHSLQSIQRVESKAELLAESLEQIALAWEQLDADEKRELLGLVLETLQADREGRDIKLRIKIYLLPEREITIPYRTNQGKSRSTSSPFALMTLTELAYLHLVNQGMSEEQIRQHWNLKPSVVKSYAKRVRKRIKFAAMNRTLTDMRSENDPNPELSPEMSIAAIAELAKPRIEEVWDRLQVGPKSKTATPAVEQRMVDGEIVPYLSGVLMEVFPLFASGASVDDVAKRLGMSNVTVQGRRSKILKLVVCQK